jgi:hypothetical protein
VRRDKTGINWQKLLQRDTQWSLAWGGGWGRGRGSVGGVGGGWGGWGGGGATFLPCVSRCSSFLPVDAGFCRVARRFAGHPVQQNESLRRLRTRRSTRPGKSSPSVTLRALAARQSGALRVAPMTRSRIVTRPANRFLSRRLRLWLQLFFKFGNELPRATRSISPLRFSF